MTVTHTKAVNRQIPLYPLRFEPIYQYRIWGGRHLADILSLPLPGSGPIGEAWILSDREDHQSKVAGGVLNGCSISQLMEQFPDQLLGKKAGHFQRFPLLLKFLDAKDLLSVQVHPSNADTDMLPVGETGKTEAWVVVSAEADSRVYASLKAGTTHDSLRLSLANGSVAEYLEHFLPKSGDCILLPAGTIHSLGNNLVVFEVQQNSDVTYRLYDWEHVDAQTGKTRELQADQALRCTDFSQTAVLPVVAVVESESPVMRERLIQCEYFEMWRHSGQSRFFVGAPGDPRILVCLNGSGQLEHNGLRYAVSKGDVLLLPAEVGGCDFLPQNPVVLLEIALPEGK